MAAARLASACCEVDAEGLAVDLDQWGAGGDPVADLDQNSVDLAADLGRDGDGVEGADLTDQLHRWALLADLGGDELNLARCEGPLESLGGGGGIVVIRTVAADEATARRGRRKE